MGFRLEFYQGTWIGLYCGIQLVAEYYPEDDYWATVPYQFLNNLPKEYDS